MSFLKNHSQKLNRKSIGSVLTIATVIFAVLVGTSASGNSVQAAGSVVSGSQGNAVHSVADGAGILFDWNGDGITNESDYQSTAEWLKNYSLSVVSNNGVAAGSYVLNGNNEASDSIKALIFQEIGSPASGIDYGIDIKNVPRYCINNVGLGTPAGNQTPYGTCWAFAENAAVESAILREKTGYAGNSVLSVGTTAPKLTGLDEDERMSSLYLATKAFSLQTSGKQKGEGLTLRPGNSDSIYNAGGFLTTAQVVYSNWDGPVLEEDEPYSALIQSGQGIGGQTNANAGVDSGSAERESSAGNSAAGGSARSGNAANSSAAASQEKNFGYVQAAVASNATSKSTGNGTALLHTKDTVTAHLQDYYIYSSPAITEEDAANQLRVWKEYDPSATKTLKQAVVKYGAIAIMDGTDSETPSAQGMTSSFNYNTWMQYSSAVNVTHNHAVTIVGWDDTIPASSFSSDPSKQPEGNGAWLVKNSWGSYEDSVEQYGKEWVDDYFSRVTPGTAGYYLAQQAYNYGIPDADGHGTGYFWLSYYDRSIAGAAAAADVDIADDGYDYDHNYTYQYAISLSNSTLALPTDNNRTKVCNVYTAGGKEQLKAVSVEAPTTGITAEISIYTYDSKSGSGSADSHWDPEKGKLASSKTVVLAEMGLHTVKLDQPVSLQKGQKFAVVEKISSAVSAPEANKTMSGEADHSNLKKGKTGSSGLSVITWLNLETALIPSLQTAENYSNEMTNVVANAGETWAYVRKGNGVYSWVRPQDLNGTIAGNVFQFGNALIHAYTSDQ